MPRREPETGDPPPRGSPWLVAAIHGSLAAFLCGAAALPTVLASAPLLIVYRRWGRGLGLAASAAGCMFLVGFTWVQQTGVLGTAGGGREGETTWFLVARGFGFLLVAALPAGLLAISTARTPTGVRALAVATGLLSMLAVAAVGLSEWLLLEAGLWTQLRAGVETMLADSPLLQDWVAILLPSLTASAALVLLWVNLVYSRWFTGKQGRGDDLCTFRLPPAAMPCLMASIALFVTQVGPLSPLFPRSAAVLAVAGNVLVMGVTLYWLQGLAVANYYFFRLRIGPVAKVAGIVLQALFMVRPATTAIFAAAGLVDAWFDLRRLRAHDEIGMER